jgi:hypothetical protein
MPEEPQPEPQKAKADAAPKAASSSQGFDPSSAQAYVPRPSRPPGKSRVVLALAALIAAGAVAATAIHFRPPSGPPPIAAAASENKVITVTEADINVAATKREREAEPAAVAPAQAPAGPSAAAPEARAASPLPVAPPELISPKASAPQSVLTPRARQAVRAEGWSVFSMKLLDNMDQDGDVVMISIDGVPMSYLSLTNGGASLDIPLKKGESHRITVTATHDGVGGVTLGLQTSAGTVMSRNMAVGESETWTIDYK